MPPPPHEGPRGAPDAGELAFGRWRLQPRARRLLADDMPVPVGSRAVDILLALIEADGAVVTKDALLRRVWPGTVVEENNLQVQISALRRAMGPDGAALIATVPGRGYRFIGGPAARSGANTGAGPAVPAAGGAADPGRASLAVMPFRNLGGAGADDLLADGMVEDLITALSRIRWCHVIARNASFTYRGRDVPPPQVGRELGVRYLIEGAVRRAGPRVRVNVELVDTASGAQIWADRFDGDTQDVFALQDQVVAGILGAVEPNLRQAEIDRARRRRPTGAPQAYEAYLRAIGQMHPLTEANSAAALHLLDAALAADPQFALALAAAAYCRMWRISQGFAGEHAPQERTRSLSLAEQAVALAPDDPTVLAQTGAVIAFLADRAPAAVELVERAARLMPSSALARTSAGWARLYAGEAEAAIAHFAEAVRLDPIGPRAGDAMAGTAFAHLLAGRGGEAIAWGRRAVAASPDLLSAHRAHVAALGAAGEPAEAALRQLLARDPAFNLADYARLRGAQVAGPLFAVATDGLRRAGVPERPADVRDTGTKWGN